jgi:parallel beta-helix repeat protein
MKTRYTLFSVIFAFLILIGIQAVEVSVANPTHLAPALSNITIAKDGSVQPSSGLIKQNGSTYFLTRSIVGSYCINVLCGNIVFDGQGNSIDSGETKTSFGIHIMYVGNVTVRNVVINRFYSGIMVEHSGSSKIDNVTISNSESGNLMNMKSDGINLLTSVYTKITNCHITNCDGAGITLGTASNNNTISDNDISTNQAAISISDSGNNVFFRNNVVNSSLAVYINRGYPNLSVNPLTPKNIFYFNNFINNSQQVDFKQYSGKTTVDESYSNSWDNGSIGNYWSDNNNSNPYVLNDVNIDHFPLNKQITFELSPIQNPVSTIIPSPTSNQTLFSEILNPTYLIAIAAVIVIVVVASIALVCIKRRKSKPAKPKM